MNPERVIFPGGRQRRFLEAACSRLSDEWEDLAILCGVHPRTLRDWRREKYTMSALALEAIRRRLKVPPGRVKMVSPYRHIQRAGHLGARARYQLYGNPGTAEGRRKGGRIAQQRFHSDPDHARRVGFILRKSIREPERSSKLAEFVGIVLGDGSLSDYQLSIYFNARSERDLGIYVQGRIRELFGISSSLRENARNALVLVASGKNLVEFLHKLGLRSGDKIANGVRVPDWIFRRSDLMKGCLRGLVDTDGTVSKHNHLVRGHKYKHIELGFASHSPALLQAAHRLFIDLGFQSKIYPERGRVLLFKWAEIRRYMDVIGTHNPHHLKQFKVYSFSRVVQ